MKRDEDKSARRKSGRFLGLTLKAFLKDASEKPESNDDDRVSLLKRFGSRRNMKNKNKKVNTDTISSSNHGDNDLVPQSVNESVPSPDAGCTLKTRHNQKVHSGKVFGVMHRSPWVSDSDSDDCPEAEEPSVRRHTSLKERSHNLRRSLSGVCRSSRSRLVVVKGVSSRVENMKVKGRRSLGANILSAVITRSRSKLILGTASHDSTSWTQNEASENNVNGQTSETESVGQKKCITKEVSSLRQRSLDFLGLSVRKNKPKRDSYDEMNRQRDELASAKKLPLHKKREQCVSMAVTVKQSSSFKWTGNNMKTGEDCEKLSDDRSSQPSLCQKSVGVTTPHVGRDRRYSGVYSVSATPALMTCGFVMTDSPPDDVPYMQHQQQDTCMAKCANGNNEPHSSITFDSGSLQPFLLGYNDDSLPWVALKRKRRTELQDKSVVNRCNAGHTPLPPRKRRKSYHERLIN